MTGHRTYLHIGAGTIVRTAHITSKKGHRTFTHPVQPKEAKVLSA